MKVLFATTNPAKVKKYKDLLAEKGIELITIKDLDFKLPIDDNRKNAKRGASKRQTSAQNCNQVHADFCRKTIFKLSSDIQTTRCRFTGRHPC